MAKKINMFISHYGGDEGYIEKFKSLIGNNYEVRDSSIVESEPNRAKNKDYIKTLLRAQIDWAGTIVVLVGPKTHERDWVNWEIEYASKVGDKNIVGVYLPGATDSDLPEMLDKYGTHCVAWNKESIYAALEGNIDEPIWQDSQGNPRTGNGLPRATC